MQVDSDEPPLVNDILWVYLKNMPRPTEDLIKICVSFRPAAPRKLNARTEKICVRGCQSAGVRCCPP